MFFALGYLQFFQIILDKNLMNTTSMPQLDANWGAWLASCRERPSQQQREQTSLK